MRLIDADALIDKKILLLDLRDDVRMFQDAVLLTDIINAPTIDAEPVKRGRWENGTCPNCGQVDFSKPNHCPNCGAKMDLEVAT